MDFASDHGNCYTPDYLLKMAAHIETLAIDDCHSSIYKRRADFARKLRAMALGTVTPEYASALETLRLQIYKLMAS